MGESAGGLAVLAVAELERGIRDPDYLGGIAVSGVADAKEFYEQLARENSLDQLIFLAYGVQTVFPQFQVNQMITEKALSMYRRIENSCAVPLTGSEMSANQMLKPGWEENGFVCQFFARNTVGEQAAYGPLLIVSSSSDPAVRNGMTARAVARMCKQRDMVQFHQYQDSGSAGVLGDSVRDQLTWIQARLAGRPASSNCH
jgi:acetyl esterase/lipase